MDIKKLKFNSLYPTTPKKRAPTSSNSGYSILDQFINNILPMIQNQKSVMNIREDGLMKKERLREDNVRREQHNLSRPAPAFPQIARAIRESEKPMNVVLGNQLSPYQEATLAMRGQELGTRTELAKDKQTEIERRNQATEEEKKARLKVLQDKEAKNDLSESEALELKFNKDMARLQAGQTFTTKRDAVQQGNALDRIVKTSEGAMARTKEGANAAMERQTGQQTFTTERDKKRFESDITKIDKTFTNRQSLAADRPDTKQLVLQRANELITRNPEYADFIEINQDTGEVEVKPQKKDWSGNPVGPSDTERQQIREALFGTDPTKATSVITPDAEAPPPGMKPGGKWITMKSGKRVYEEPDA